MKRPKKRRPYQREENPHALFRKMTRDHTDVLQNIEFAIVTAWREHPEIDDRAVAHALKSAIAETEPAGKLAEVVADALENTKLLRGEMDENLWGAGLKVVLESVHTHSEMQPGDTDYLDFVRAYIV